MQRQGRIDGYARMIFKFLDEHRDEQFRFGEVCHRLGIPTSKATKKAVALGAGLAEQVGLYLQVPCHENDWTIGITDDVTRWPKPDRQLERIQDGLQKRRDQGASFVAQNVDQLDAGEQAILDALREMDEQIEASRTTRANLMAALRRSL